MIRRFALALAMLACALAARAAAPVAFVTDVQGDARLAGAGKLAFLGELSPGTTVVLGAGAKAAVMYVDSGTEFLLVGAGEFLIDPAAATAIKGMAPARRTVGVRADPTVVARVSRSATASLRMRGVTAAAVAKPGPAYPSNTRIATLQPTLRWNGEAGAGGFEVKVAASDGTQAWKGSSRANAQRLPVKLAAGARYSWSVASGGKLLGEAHFETLPADALARAEKSRASAKSFSDRVMYAFVLQDIGADPDAREVWAELARERPDLPELAVLAK